jgi:hypothetical protein
MTAVAAPFPPRTVAQLEAGDRVVIVGAGPAGLTAAYLLAKIGVRATVLEADEVVGGISRTAQYKGFRFDIGGHRFFTKIEPVQALWEEILADELITVPRLSRIHYDGRFFDYPLKAANALRGLGPVNAALIVLSYLKWRFRPYPVEDNFEQWVTNRFGKRLYETFFKTYTEKVWGIPCTEIRAEWAAQRIQGLSLAEAILNATALNRRSTSIKTLIHEFRYPRLGPGQMWGTDNPDAEIKAFGGDQAAPSEESHINEVREALDKISGVSPVAAGLIRGKIGKRLINNDNRLRSVCRSRVLPGPVPALAAAAASIVICEGIG